MHQTIKNLSLIKSEIQQKSYSPQIIAVSKTFAIDKILPLIDFGHINFGENKVQEAISKWSDIKKMRPELKLHLIGKLQTNKVKFAVALFDYIHTLDSIKLAEKISLEQNKINKKLKIFIQVNIGNEPQKNGIDINNVGTFYNECQNKFELDIIGLMCLPPKNVKDNFYFNKMKNLNNELGLKELSMGMSSDYINAASCGATFLRIGSNIFGARD